MTYDQPGRFRDSAADVKAADVVAEPPRYVVGKLLIRWCAWHRELPRPRRWLAFMGIRAIFPFWPIRMTSGICSACRARFYAGWRARRAPVNRDVLTALGAALLTVANIAAWWGLALLLAP